MSLVRLSIVLIALVAIGTTAYLYLWPSSETDSSHETPAVISENLELTPELPPGRIVPEGRYESLTDVIRRQEEEDHPDQLLINGGRAWALKGAPGFPIEPEPEETE